MPDTETQAFESHVDCHWQSVPTYGGIAAVATLTLNHPERANSLSPGMIEALRRRLGEVAAHPHCRALVLTGRGQNFCAGADLVAMEQAAQAGASAATQFAQAIADLLAHLHSLPMATVAVVHGATYGGGIGLAVCCDVVLASEASRWQLSELKLGLLPAVIAPYLLERATPAFVRRWALTADALTGTAAHHAGCVDRVYGSDRSRVVSETLNTLLSCSPTARCQWKELCRQLSQPPAALATTVAALATSLRHPEASSGRQAFAEKSRQTPWTPSQPLVWEEAPL